MPESKEEGKRYIRTYIRSLVDDQKERIKGMNEGEESRSVGAELCLHGSESRTG